VQDSIVSQIIGSSMCYTRFEALFEETCAMSNVMVYRALQRALAEGDPVALATIISLRGSVPREVGAKMMIHPYGRHAGTIGGGCGEADVIRAALDVLLDGRPRTVVVDLTEPISRESVGVCGGTMTVYVERWLPSEASATP
jgi:xanthine/CO dehydrogenase XdhC/CoxF family maturation factor